MWLWYVLQISVAVLVLASNQQYQWTPNGYLASLIAFGSAFFVSWILSQLLLLPGRFRRLAARLSGRVLESEPESDNLRLPASGRHIGNPF